MKAIVSHDIDHFTIGEHLFKDFIVPKHIVRAHLEWLNGAIPFSELAYRMMEVFSNKWSYIDELIEFNKSFSVPSTFFVGVKNGLGLSYSLSQALACVDFLKSKNVSFGLHGIEFDDREKIKEEFELFQKVCGLKKFGMRMHYVRMNELTLRNFSELGAQYDSTVSAFENPYKIGIMWEFPFQIMDGWIIENGRRRQSRNLQECKDATLHILDKCETLRLNFIGIDFHDRYFSRSHNTWMKWYTWIIEELSNRKLEFTNFESAIADLSINEELNGNSSPIEKSAFVF